MTNANLVQPVAEFIENLNHAGGKPLYELSPEEARGVLLKAQSGDTTKTETVSEEINIPIGNGREMRTIIIKPKIGGESLPIVFYIHGGGWVMGDEKTHNRLIRQLSERIPAAIVFPVYTPSPEAQYPQTTNDLFNALQYISEYGAKYNMDTSRLVVAGDSVGGNMAAVMAIMAKENNNIPPINFQLLFYPVTDVDFTNKSYQDFADGPWLTKKAMEWFWKQYAPNKKSYKEIYASPLRAPLEKLEGLPPALIITDENDVLRDEGEAYARKLNEAGVDAVSIRINGTIHDFLMLNALAETSPSKIALILAVATLQNIFAVMEEKAGGED